MSEIPDFPGVPDFHDFYTPRAWGALSPRWPNWLLRLLAGTSYRAHITLLHRECAAGGHPMIEDYRLRTPVWRCPCGERVRYGYE